jgi:hypothetical protein
MIKVYASEQDRRRFRRNVVAPFQPPYKLIELAIYPDHTDVSLAGEVRRAIVVALNQDPRLAKRYVDFRSYDLVAPNLDWRRAIMRHSAFAS